MNFGAANGAHTYNFFVLNNIFAGSVNAAVWISSFNDWGSGSVVVDYNLEYSTTGPLAYFQGTTYTFAQLAAYQSASGQEAHSIVAPPGFVNEAGGDYHLLSTSPAVDAGIAHVATDDYDGIARPQGAGYDIGAYERYVLPGDANEDGTVNFADLNVVLTNYNNSGGWRQGDFNGDGVVDFTDLNIVLTNYNQSLPAAAPVAPAPATPVGQPAEPMAATTPVVLSSSSTNGAAQVPATASRLGKVASAHRHVFHLMGDVEDYVCRGRSAHLVELE